MTRPDDNQGPEVAAPALTFLSKPEALGQLSSLLTQLGVGEKMVEFLATQEPEGDGGGEVPSRDPRGPAPPG